MIKRQQLLGMAASSAIILFSLSKGQCGEKSRLVSNLEAGKKQTVVAYGASLTMNGAWVEQLSAELNRRYPGLAVVINSGLSSMSSKWGVDNLDDLVINKKPDTVLLEFAIGDAYQSRSQLTVPQARSNLVNMIDRIMAANKSCEIILMVMNPPTGYALEVRPELESYNQMYRDVAAQRYLMLIDHYPNWQQILKADPKRFSAYIPDGVHPNAEGCQMVITPAIISALGMTAEPKSQSDAGKPRAEP